MCFNFLRCGLAASTHRTYSSGQSRFISFCTQLGVLHPNGSPCPADEWTLCLFATFLAQSIRHSSIKVYLSAVRSLHIDLGFSDPLVNCLRLQRVVRGIKRVQGDSSANSRLPVTDTIMLVIYQALNMSIPDHLMFWSACTLAYFGFLRSSEFTVPSLSTFSPEIHLALGDLAVDSLSSPSCMRICIKASKTDPFRKGCFIHIGRGKPPLCALQAMVNFLSVRGQTAGPLFMFVDGRPLSRVILTEWLRNIISSAGLEGNYSSHSFRIGAATVAARKGIPDHLIQTLGRWNSNAYQLYIRTPADVLACLSQQLS